MDCLALRGNGMSIRLQRTTRIRDPQGALPEDKREIARQERERLKMQQQQKKEALERLRNEAKQSDAKGEVRSRCCFEFRGS